MNRILLILIGLMSLTGVQAQEETDSIRVFTKEQPLVYEDAWDLWPYAFLNEKGEPVGFNIDLLRLICKELDIPYIIKLKPTSEALNDLKSGSADLMCGMDAHFHDDYARYGKSVLQLFTHSIVHQKGVKPVIREVEDLANYRVIVHDGSFSHHLMIRKGWGKNAVPYDDMQEAVQKVHLDPGSQIVWNTLSLKWLINKFQLDDLELSPVDVQHGEYKFMSNNPRLLQRIDSVYTILRAQDKLQPIQNKWFYPEREDSGIPTWIWKLAILLALGMFALLIYYAIYRQREKKVKRALLKDNNRLALILNTSKVRIWIYHVETRTVTPLDEKGSSMPSHPSVDFFRQTTPSDFERLSNALASITSGEKDNVTLNITGKDEASDKELRDFTVDLSVFRRDKEGHPIDIIGTRSDTTEERLKQKESQEMMLRYQAVFNSAMIDMVVYDENGIITDMNDKAWNAFPGKKEEILARNIHISQVLGMEVDLDTMEPIYLTQIYHNKPDDKRVLNLFLKRPEMYYELKLVPVRDNQGKLLGIYGTGRNVTEVAKSYTNLQKNIQLLQEANTQMGRYIKNIDYVLQNGNLRIVTYSPDNHILTIYSEIDHVQHTLTQARTIELTDEEYKKKAQRLLNAMDNLTAASIKTTVKTSLRIHNKSLYLHLSFIPIFDNEGGVTGYFGICRDVSEIKVTEEELEHETVKAQEVETLKNTFLRNMSYEIRTPLSSVVGFAELFETEHSPEDETVFITEIKESASTLLKLINDILFLSRLDARMIEIKPKPIDFAAVFENRCQTAWFNYKKPGVTYSVDNPYNHLVVDIDDQILGTVIDQIIANAAQHTTSGLVRARYDYTGDHLVLAFQDTGSGIPESILDRIFDRFMSTDGHRTGLGLSICREIINQMDGKITIKSQEGEGTIVWVSVPCKLIDIDHK
ncbi:MAG: transporter substrate-binding domain-containing protein [Prevotella sp.]|nr:transporter substrate-binding domain-containing protein [Prevotella sp.]